MNRPSRRKLPDSHTMPFAEHIEALRWHLIRALIGVGVCLAVCLSIGKALMVFLLGPLQRALDAHQAGKIVAPTVFSGMSAFFQISMIGSLMLASPWIVYQI